ncbi:hypothetical protein BLA60_22390 [Actinophytocola xinjiangensis]|uniref:PE family protein n=1 Tax=Actinophytocola xinjiangensis TaxID=485602 RepID=A0A7Z0WJU6_9PSEU|nr:hypothetical protein [Actinophytocola xinjiangensis]OLF08761.1 hypothetical protein BLA60_22390 [Actinophytocola xinjiangensis]
MRDFTVQPEKLKLLRDETAKIAARNHILVEQLAKAQESPMSDLLGSPTDLGPSGPPVDFTASSEAVLTNLASMIGELHRLHVAIESQFTRMTTALDESREAYRRVDGEHAAVFDGILRDPGPGGS